MPNPFPLPTGLASKSLMLTLSASDINTNNVGSYTGLYWYMNSGHVQTESYRQGLHGPYLMYFSRSGTPATNIDTSFFANLGIKGYVATSGRGYVSGTASGANSALKWVVHWLVHRSCSI